MPTSETELREECEEYHAYLDELADEETLKMFMDPTLDSESEAESEDDDEWSRRYEVRVVPGGGMGHRGGLGVARERPGATAQGVDEGRGD